MEIISAFWTSFQAFAFSTQGLIALVIVILLAFSAFFSGSETALTAASRPQLRSNADKGDKGAERAMALTDDSERLIGSLLLGNNLVNILATSLATALFTSLFGDNGVAIATFVMTLLVLVFAEVLPKTYAINNAETAAKAVSAPIAVLVKILTPFVFIVRQIVGLILRAFGVRQDINIQARAREEIAGAIALHHSEGGVLKDDRDRLLAALDLRLRSVEEIMLHRSHIEMINQDDNPDQILEQCLASSYTRLPVYKDNPENIVGVVHAKDLLREVNRAARDRDDARNAIARLKILDIAMKPYFVPETTSLDHQMREFLRLKSHFALVVDEYGTLQGLITLEDILEEIVGDIADEHDIDIPALESEPDGTIMVDGQMTIRDLNRLMDWNLPDEEANTVAGLVIHEAQSIPVPSQMFTFHGFRFTIVSRDRNRITKLKIKRAI